MRNLSSSFAVALVVTLLGCGEREKRKGHTQQTLTLSRGATLSVSTSSDGASEIVATVPTGTRGAGTYTSRAESLVDAAREAKNALNEPGVEIRITVDDQGHLLAVSHERTK